MKRILFLGLIFILVFGVIGCSDKSDPREREIVQLVVKNKHSEAITRAKELYDGNELADMIKWINTTKQQNEEMEAKIKEVLATPAEKLEIQPNWKIKVDGNYIYITGRVKNISNTNITYFKLTAEFLDDKGNILDTDYTNSTETIKPNSMKEFEIMHKNQTDYKNIRLIVEEVNN